MLSLLVSPWNVIYPKKYLDQEPHYFKTNIQVDIAFCHLPPAEVDALVQQKGNELHVQAASGITCWGITPNLTRPPMQDERVRKVLGLALDRPAMARTLAPLTGLQAVGGLLRPVAP
jgi:ABC-type oligopeptide transport system substrate-binding subunit